MSRFITNENRGRLFDYSTAYDALKSKLGPSNKINNVAGPDQKIHGRAHGPQAASGVLTQRAVARLWPE